MSEEAPKHPKVRKVRSGIRQYIFHSVHELGPGVLAILVMEKIVIRGENVAQHIWQLWRA